MVYPHSIPVKKNKYDLCRSIQHASLYIHIMPELLTNIHDTMTSAFSFHYEKVLRDKKDTT